MMDTLKWVFIGIAIFVVILIILGVVYWFMFGSSSSTTSSTENVVDENGNIVDGAEGANAEANADANADAINNQQDPNDPYAYNDAPVSQDPYSDNLDNNASSTSMFSSLIPSSSSFSRNDAVSPEVPVVPVVVPEAPEVPVVVPEAPEVPVVVPEVPDVVPEVPVVPDIVPEVPIEAPQSLSSSSSSPPIIGSPAPTNVVQK